MQELHNVSIPDGQPCFQFYHLDVEYCIWIWLMDGGPDVFRINLAEVIPVGGGWGTKIVLAQGADKKFVNDNTGVKALMSDIFLPKVNKYLSALGGGAGVFPVDGLHADQFNYIIKNNLSYVDGQIVLNF